MNYKDNVTDKKYTLVIKNEVTLNWNDLAFLETAITTVPNTHGTFIHFNELGLAQYDEDRYWRGRDESN